MQNKRQIILVIILIGLLTVVGSLLTNVVSVGIVIPLWLAGSLLVVVIGLGIALAVWQYLLQADRATPIISSQNRQRMLERVRAFWITGVLEKSLHGAALITLGLHERPGAVANPWHLAFQQPDKSEQSLPPGTRITLVYDKAGGELLILGEPGSGKTTLLLELARDLLDRAEKDDAHPVPVIFNLSSWAAKQQSIADWIVDELAMKYQVPRKLGHSWVDNDQILPLLDGLDEVASDYRVACTEAINVYRQKHMVPMVVCSRKDEYLFQKEQLLLGCAVVVQPLTEQQVDDYLSSAGGQLAAVRVALRKDRELQELATTPLMLNVLVLAYEGKSVEDILTADSLETQRRHVFATYVQRMLQRCVAKTCYIPQQTTHWLTWLAKQMVQHNQSEFYIERIQPDWLIKSRSLFIYRVIEGAVKLLAFGPSNRAIEPAEIIIWSWQNARRSLVAGLVYWPVIVLIGGLIGGLIGWLSSRLIVGVGVGLVLGLGIGMVILQGRLIGAGLSGRRMDNHNIFTPNQGIWRSARHGVIIGLLTGLSSVLAGGVVFMLGNNLALGLNLMLGGGEGIGLAAGLTFGGAAFIQHFLLRFLLWRAGYAPLNYPRFLDYAAERILLRKVGGGYIFVHRMLLEYFASLEATL